MFATTWLEVEVGRRPVEHLWPMATRALERALVCQLGLLPLRRGSPSRLLGLHVTAAGDAREAVAMLDRDGRRGALALRVVAAPTWRVAVLEMPPLPGARGRLARQPLRLPPRW